MDTALGTWEELDADRVRAFLADSGDEPLTWEAKADDDRGGLSPGSVRKAVAGFANAELGGVLIVGAVHEGLAWHLQGLIQPRQGPLADWLDAVIRDGMRPVPSYQIRTFDGARGPAALVLVHPHPLPPVLTTDGVLFVRTSGSTVAVSDPSEVARIFARGRARQEACDAAVTRAVVRLTNRIFSRPVAVVGIAPTGLLEGPPTLSVLRQSFVDDLQARLFALPLDGVRERRSMVSMSADSVQIRDDGAGWHLRADVSGVLMAWREVPAVVASGGAAPFVADAKAAWRALGDIAGALGWYGPTFVAVHVRVPPSGPDQLATMRTATPNPGQDDLDAMVRRLARSGGQYMPEPD